MAVCFALTSGDIHVSVHESGKCSNYFVIFLVSYMADIALLASPEFGLNPNFFSFQLLH